MQCLRVRGSVCCVLSFDGHSFVGLSVLGLPLLAALQHPVVECCFGGGESGEPVEACRCPCVPHRVGEELFIGEFAVRVLPAVSLAAGHVVYGSRWCRVCGAIREQFGGFEMFRCDPVLEPAGRGLVALRTVAGEAFRWEPGGDVDEFVGFVGDEFQAVAGQVYRRIADGVLVPFDVNRSLVVVKPVAGDMHFLSPDEFMQRWAMLEQPVAVKRASVGPMQRDDVDAVPEVAQQTAPKVFDDDPFNKPASEARKPGRPKKQL